MGIDFTYLVSGSGGLLCDTGVDQSGVGDLATALWIGGMELCFNGLLLWLSTPLDRAVSLAVYYG